MFTVETNPSLGECYTWFWYETKTGIVCTLVIFSTQNYVQPLQWKAFAETF